MSFLQRSEVTRQISGRRAVLSVFRGYSAGSSGRGPISSGYGLTAEEAAPYLTLPEGKKLTHDGKERVDLWQGRRPCQGAKR